MNTADMTNERLLVTLEMSGSWTPAATSALVTRLDTLAPLLPPDVPLVHPLRAPSLVWVPTGGAEVIVRVGAAVPLGVGHPDHGALVQGLAVGESSAWRQPYWSHAAPPVPVAEAGGALRAAIARLERLAGGGLTADERVPGDGDALPLEQVNAALDAHLVAADVSIVVVGGDAPLAQSLFTPQEDVAPLPFRVEQIAWVDVGRVFQ